MMGSMLPLSFAPLPFLVVFPTAERLETETSERMGLCQEGSGDLQEGHFSVTKGASPLAKHPLKVPFTKA